MSSSSSLLSSPPPLSRNGAATAVDVDRIQSIVLIRHAVAKHNVAIDPRTGRPPVLTDPSYLDPPLLPNGKIQAVQAGLALRRDCDSSPLASCRPELIVTSPLTRCLQTATLAFVPGDAYDDERTASIAAAAATTSCKGAPSMVCHEDVREAFGMHYPDQRRRKSVLQKHWPHVQFDNAMTETDTAWRPDRRETWEDVHCRQTRFLTWLVRQSQTRVAVVTHGVWIEALLRTHQPDVLSSPSSTTMKRVHNTDAFMGEIVSRNGLFQRLQSVRQIYGQQ